MDARQFNPDVVTQGMPFTILEPVIIFSKRRLKSGMTGRSDQADQLKAVYAPCQEKMKSKLRRGLLAMYAFIDRTDTSIVHDVFIFRNSGVVVQWVDEVVNAKKGTTPELYREWLSIYDTGAPDWWTGVVFGSWNEDVQVRLEQMGATLQFLKPGTGYMKAKVPKQITGPPAIMYLRRTLQVFPWLCVCCAFCSPSLCCSGQQV